jgi:hypothetical protein
VPRNCKLASGSDSSTYYTPWHSFPNLLESNNGYKNNGTASHTLYHSCSWSDGYALKPRSTIDLHPPSKFTTSNPICFKILLPRYPDIQPGSKQSQAPYYSRSWQFRGEHSNSDSPLKERGHVRTLQVTELQRVASCHAQLPDPRAEQCGHSPESDCS